MKLLRHHRRKARGWIVGGTGTLVVVTLAWHLSKSAGTEHAPGPPPLPPAVIRLAPGQDVRAKGGKPPLPRSFDFVAPEKRSLVEQVERDYVQMATAIHRARAGVLLPEDLVALELLAEEKRLDLAAVLTEAEMEEYDLRFSPTARDLQRSLAAIDGGPDEYRQLFPLARAFDENWRALEIQAGSDLSFLRGRKEAARRLAVAIKDAAGEERGEIIVWSHDPEFLRLAAIARQANLSRTLPADLMDLRDAVSRSGLGIVSDRGSSPEQKRLLLLSLAEVALNEARNVVGSSSLPELDPASFVWLEALRRGEVIVYDPLDRTATTFAIPRSPKAAETASAAGGSSSSL